MPAARQRDEARILTVIIHINNGMLDTVKRKQNTVPKRVPAVKESPRTGDIGQLSRCSDLYTVHYSRPLKDHRLIIFTRASLVPPARGLQSRKQFISRRMKNVQPSMQLKI